MADSTPLFNPNDGLTGRNGGPYLDEEQARADEVRRARIEGREPDLDTPTANAGIQLSTAAQMLATLAVTNNPSMERAQAEVLSKAYATSFEETKDLLSTPITDALPDTSDQPSNADADTVVYNELDPNAPVTETTAEDAGDGEPSVEITSATEGDDTPETDAGSLNDFPSVDGPNPTDHNPTPSE